MSAIFGVYNLDEKLVSSRLLEQMSISLAHRGKDRIGIWTEENLGLGHRMLWTTPESIDEQLPTSINKRHLAITADARIDNRTDLLAQLDLSGFKTDRAISDSEIILRTYEKWGEDCPAKLIGDFAFVIWDGLKRRLFCARDHFGIKPFYYYVSEKCFVFASEIKALFVHEEVPRTLNEEMIADYFIGNFEDKTATFYQKILRLPPAHTLTIAPERNVLSCYYTLNNMREAVAHSNKDYADGLREIFTEAVRCRLRSAKPIGSMLSGGLDSSSIACVARNLIAGQTVGEDTNRQLLPTFSLIYDRVKECDERVYINSVLSQGGFDPHFIPGDNQTPLSHLKTVCWHADRPVTGPGQSSIWEFNQAITKTGVRIVLDGHDGDSAVSHGYKYLDELAQAGQWLSLAREAWSLAPVFSMSQWKMMKSYAHRYRWQPLVRSHPDLKKIERLGRRLFTRPKSSNSWSAANFSFRLSLINQDFAKKVNLNERYKSSKRFSPDAAHTAREEQFRLINDGGQVAAIEECDAVAAGSGIEMRYPFWDKRLIEYCLALPGEQKCHRGWNRIVMRRAMNEILPADVCWRRGKTDFTPSFLDGMLKQNQNELETLLKDTANVIDRFFDKKALSQTYKKQQLQGFQNDDTENRVAIRALWDLASFSAWIQQTTSLN